MNLKDVSTYLNDLIKKIRALKLEQHNKKMNIIKYIPTL